MILRSFCLCLCIASAFAFASGLGAQTPAGAPTNAPPRPPVPLPPLPTAKPGDEIIDSFKYEGDIDGILAALETHTGRAVIRPGTLPVAPGGYSLKLSHIPRSELVLALETLLALNQIGVIPLGERFIKVVPLSLVRAETPEFISGSTLDLPPSSKIATKLYQLTFLRVGEFFNQGLNLMLTPGIGGGVVILEKANAALITDTVSNLQRLEQLINALDKPMANGFVPKFYTVRSAKASDLVTKLHTLLSGPIQNQIGSATTYNADDRTNQVIVLADPREQAFFEDLIQKLDVKADPNTHNEVIYLKHADAKDVTTLLSALISGQNAATQKVAGQSVRPGELMTTPTPPAPQPANPAIPSALQALGVTTNVFSNLMTIQPDERSNSVVVSGTVDDIRLLKELIDKLDIALAQVRIQVIIAEVTLKDTDISGITSLGLTVGTDSIHGTHITNWAGGGTAPAGGTAPLTPGTSISGWDFTNGVVNPLAFNAAFNPTSSGQKSVVHVLQAPVIVTAHNKPAEVIVGEQDPIINGGQSAATGVGATGLASSFTSTYQNIAVDLNVTPLIGDNGDIQLTIDQKVDDVINSVSIGGFPQPVIGHREVKSFLTVKDGQMIVLGGLQKTKKSSSHNKIGFLFEIPIISQLLGGHNDDLERTELLFFIRPHVIPPDEGMADAQKHIDELSNKDQINRFLKSPGIDENSKTENFLDRFKK